MLNVVLWIALVVSIPTSGFHPIYGTAAAVGAVVIAGVAGAVRAMLRGRDAFADRVAALAGRLPKVNPQHVRATLAGLADQLAVLVADRDRLRAVRGLMGVDRSFRVVGEAGAGPLAGEHFLGLELFGDS